MDEQRERPRSGERISFPLGESGARAVRALRDRLAEVRRRLQAGELDTPRAAREAAAGLLGLRPPPGSPG
ncbi:MAG: hypothetical protein ACE5JG_04440 [Planctomycetota bacterium]